MLPVTAKHSRAVTLRGTEDSSHGSATCKCNGQARTVGHGARVKRIGRCLAGKPRARCWFRWQRSGELDVHSNVDWRGDKATRRSVSAGVIMRGGHCLQTWTKKQQVVSLSLAESELCAAVKAGSEGLGVQSFGKGLGCDVRAELAPGRLSSNVPLVAEDWAKPNTSTCRTCGCKSLPSLAGSSRRRLARM